MTYGIEHVYPYGHSEPLKQHAIYCAGKAQAMMLSPNLVGIRS